MYELQSVKKNADGIIVSSARFSLLRGRLKGTAGAEWSRSHGVGAAIATGIESPKPSRFGGRTQAYPTGHPINSLPVTSRPIVMNDPYRPRLHKVDDKQLQSVCRAGITHLAEVGSEDEIWAPISRTAEAVSSIFIWRQRRIHSRCFRTEQRAHRAPSL